MESARVMMTVTVKPGLRHNWRAANLGFCPKASIDTPPGETAGISPRRLCLPYVDVPEEVPLQQRTGPSAEVTRAETCRELPLFANLVEDQVRQVRGGTAGTRPAAGAPGERDPRKLAEFF